MTLRRREALRVFASAAALVLGASDARIFPCVRAETVVPLQQGRQTVLLPVRLDGAQVRLEATMDAPAGKGPFAMLVFNHGSTGLGHDPRLYRRTVLYPDIAAFFVARGYVVVTPMRRGRGQSDGRYLEGLGPYGYSCEHQTMADGVARALADIDAAVKFLAEQPYVDRTRILVGGQSRGGLLSVAYAGTRPEIVRGVINFVGGWMGEDCAERTNVNAEVFARAGARLRLATLWIYGTDDRYYGIAHSQGNFAAFTKAGGTGDFVVLTPMRPGEGHMVWRQPADWSGAVDEYLRRIGMP